MDYVFRHRGVGISRVVSALNLIDEFNVELDKVRTTGTNPGKQLIIFVFNFFKIIVYFALFL